MIGRAASRAHALLRISRVSSVGCMSSAAPTAANIPTAHMTDKETAHITKAHMDYMPVPYGDFKTEYAKASNAANMRLGVAFSVFLALQLFMYFGGYYSYIKHPEMKNKPE